MLEAARSSSKLCILVLLFLISFYFLIFCTNETYSSPESEEWWGDSPSLQLYISVLSSRWPSSPTLSSSIWNWWNLRSLDYLAIFICVSSSPFSIEVGSLGLMVMLFANDFDSFIIIVSPPLGANMLSETEKLDSLRYIYVWFVNESPCSILGVSKVYYYYI